MKHTILWQGAPVRLQWRNFGEKHAVTIGGRPTIVCQGSSITPGLYYTDESSFGWWYSSNSTSLLNAWRVLQLLPQLKLWRESSGYDQTLCSMVIRMRGDNHEERLQHLAEDFGLSVEATAELLDSARNLMPTPQELEAMVGRLPDIVGLGDLSMSVLLDIEREAANNGLELSLFVQKRVEAARQKRNKKEEQWAADEAEVEAPSAAEQSLQLLMADLNVTHLLFPFFDDFGPTHVDMSTLDHFVKKHCIGRFGLADSHVPLLHTEKSPDDPSAHSGYRTRDGSFGVFYTDFGSIGPVVLDIGHDRVVLHAARYERGGTFWVLTSVRDLRTEQGDMAHGDRSDATERTVPDLRATIGVLTGHGSGVHPGRQLITSTLTGGLISRLRRRHS